MKSLFKSRRARIIWILIFFVFSQAVWFFMQVQRFVALGMVPGPEQFAAYKQVNVPPGGWRGKELQILHLNIPEYFYEKGIKKFSEVSNEELKEMVAMGFNALWVMGAWMKSPFSENLNLGYEDSQEPGRMASLFSIYDYKIASELGGETEFVDFVARARAAGLKIILDFVPTHLAPDSPVLFQNPELFQQATPKIVAARKLNEAGVIERDTSKGKRAFIRADNNDFFMADTVAFDFTNPATWVYLEEALELVARLTEGGGARIDMLTELHPETIQKKRFPELTVNEVRQKLNKISQKAFGENPENDGAVLEVVIKRVKEKYPEFVLIGESYQGQEAFWQFVGIDLTHSKFAYDWLLTRWSGGIKSFKNFLFRKDLFAHVPDEFLERSIYFLENHDQRDRLLEKIRKAGRGHLSSKEITEKAKLAMTSIATIPGAIAVYWGQFQGRDENVSSATWFDRKPQKNDPEMVAFYCDLLKTTQKNVFKEGRLRPVPILSGSSERVIIFARVLEREVAVVALNWSAKAAKLQVDLSAFGVDAKEKTLSLPPWGSEISFYAAQA